MIWQMIDTVEIANDGMIISDIDAAYGTVVEHEPGFQSMGGVLPG